MIDIATALNELRPNAEWNLPHGNYASLEWLDNTQTKPTEEEVNAKIAALQDAD